MRVLILGGTGFLSGTLATRASAAGHAVTIVTRSRRPAPDSMQCITADRKETADLAAKLRAQPDWDLVVDCIGFTPDDARQDVDLFTSRCRNFVFVSTDFVYHPDSRTVPQTETSATYLTDQSYGANKRRAEEIIEAGDTLPWTIFRPSHIYGPGSLPGCLPLHGRDPELISRLLWNEPLKLVEGGRFLQHPVYAPDLADAFLTVPDCPGALRKILNIANPDILPSVDYYRCLGELLEVEVTVESIAKDTFLTENPDKAPFCCDRVYCLDALKLSGVQMPATHLRDGLQHYVKRGAVKL